MTDKSAVSRSTFDQVILPVYAPAQGGGLMDGLNELLFGSTGPRGGKRDGIVQTAAKSMARDLGRQILRGVLGSITGGRKK